MPHSVFSPGTYHADAKTQMILADPLDVGLVVHEGGMRVLTSGAWTPSVCRDVLEVGFFTPLP